MAGTSGIMPGMGYEAYNLPGAPIYGGGLGHPLHLGGLIDSATPGRTDQLRISVQPESHIIPADVVSGLGQGNTAAGAQMLNQLLGVPSGGLGSFAKGGNTGLGQIPIVAAGGEYDVPPDAVAKLGGGDMDKGHALLDEMIKKVRAYTAKRLKKLPPPKK